LVVGRIENRLGSGEEVPLLMSGAGIFLGIEFGNIGQMDPLGAQTYYLANRIKDQWYT